MPDTPSSRARSCRPRRRRSARSSATRCRTPAAPTWRRRGIPTPIRLHGTVFDGAGDPVPDAVVEIWHADAAGRPIAERGSLERDGHGFTGFGRGRRGPRRPLRVHARSSPAPTRPDAAPYVLVTVFARGLLHHLFTRAYFADEAERNAQRRVPRERRRRRAAARSSPQADGSGGYRFDIRLQGEGETVFLEFEGVAR